MGRILKVSTCFLPLIVFTKRQSSYYWAKDISFKVRIHVIEFSKEVVDIMPIVESYFIGEHI